MPLSVTTTRTPTPGNLPRKLAEAATGPDITEQNRQTAARRTPEECNDKLAKGGLSSTEIKDIALQLKGIVAILANADPKDRKGECHPDQLGNQLEELVGDYIEHYSTHRPHRSLDQQPPAPSPDAAPPSPQIIKSTRCRGPINENRNAACPATTQYSAPTGQVE